MNTKKERFAHWEKIMSQYEQSGFTQERFCSENNISFRQFKYYRYQLRKSDKQSKTLDSRETFASIKLLESNTPLSSLTSPQDIQITLPNGIVCIASSESLTQTIQLVQELMRCG